jgi:pimeloyl-ACP methyl ester carboxylesterase
MVASRAMKISQAQQIQVSERDRNLDLLADSWPSSSLDGWDLTEETKILSRVIERESDADKLFPEKLREVMLRFPSAPIHGVQRLQEYHARLPHPEVMHTFRVLRHSARTGRPTRIFLLYNGLNESDKTVLYLQLASQLVASDPDTVCILHPFPGHLTRYPWQEFGETPLDRYLWDGSHLFRQFLRHMTETQWLLSVLTSPGSSLPQTGAPLLEDERRRGLSTEELANRLGKSWGALLAESKKSLSRARSRQNVAELPDHRPSEDALLDVVRKLRGVMGLPDEGSNDEEVPPIHVIGYSLGGFAAQSVFMTWPSIISSCATLLSGGALRALTPTGFAHREEWQTVLHSLRYELDDGMIDGRYEEGDNGVAGLEDGLFHYFQRAFYEVFQQEYRGSFQTRVQAFRKRMIFVVGGDDPIVSPQAVLESSPEGGMNILEIGGMGHFLSGNVKDEEQLEREFWIPQIGRFISDCSTHAASEHRREFQAANAALARAEAVRLCPGEPKTRMLTERERLALSPDGALSSALFGRYLDDLLARLSGKDGGYLWIFRNEIPTIMLDPDSLLRRAHSLFHDERRIETYCEEVSRRRMAWLGKLPSTIVVLPWNAERILLHQDEDHGFASQAESAMGPLRNPLTAKERIKRFRDTCETANKSRKEAILVFDGRDQATDRPGIGLPPPSLPDCWVYTSREFVDIADKEPVKAVVGALQAAVKQVASRAENKAEREKQDRDLEGKLRREELRIVAVSRARFNPRYRGKVLLNVKAVRTALHHITWCLAHATRYDPSLFDEPDVYPSPTVEEAPRPRLLSPLDDEFAQAAREQGLTGRRGVIRERRQSNEAFNGEEKRSSPDRRGASQV